MNNKIQQLIAESANQTPQEVLKKLSERFAGKIVFTTSFGIEDQVITHLIFSGNIDIKVVTLDTGRLFEETNKVYARTLEKYQKPIVPYYPQTEQLEQFVASNGPNSFYQSVENRKQCCHIRKVEPLSRALNGVECWVTGLRASQSANREGLASFAYDSAFNTIKYNPLLNWELQDCKDYVLENNVPYNSLHDKGFLSIGCAPCTRAIVEGEDFRAGRWWWEDKSKKECGLHRH